MTQYQMQKNKDFLNAREAIDAVIESGQKTFLIPKKDVFSETSRELWTLNFARKNPSLFSPEGAGKNVKPEKVAADNAIKNLKRRAEKDQAGADKIVRPEYDPETEEAIDASLDSKISLDSIRQFRALSEAESKGKLPPYDGGIFARLNKGLYRRMRGEEKAAERFPSDTRINAEATSNATMRQVITHKNGGTITDLHERRAELAEERTLHRNLKGEPPKDIDVLYLVATSPTLKDPRERKNVEKRLRYHLEPDFQERCDKRGKTIQKIPFGTKIAQLVSPNSSVVQTQFPPKSDKATASVEKIKDEQKADVDIIKDKVQLTVTKDVAVERHSSQEVAVESSPKPTRRAPKPPQQASVNSSQPHNAFENPTSGSVKSSQGTLLQAQAAHKDSTPEQAQPSSESSLASPNSSSNSQGGFTEKIQKGAQTSQSMGAQR